MRFNWRRWWPGARLSAEQRAAILAKRVRVNWRRWLLQVRGLSADQRAATLAAGVAIVAALALFPLSVHALVQRSAIEAIGFAAVLVGLSAGGILLIDGSRRYLLGVPGIFVCGYFAILLAALGGVALYLASTGSRAPLPPSKIGQFHVNSVSAILALSGFEAAILLTASPWSTRRRLIQPVLVTAAVLLPALALILLPNGGNQRGSSVPTDLSALVILAPIAGLLAGPLQAASAIEWVSVNVAIGRARGVLAGAHSRSPPGVLRRRGGLVGGRHCTRLA